jgi:hypothetical protein
MTEISRRSACHTLLGASLSLAAFGCAQDEARTPAPPPQPSPGAAPSPSAAPAPEAAPSPRAAPSPQANEPAALRRAFTASDRAMYRDCLNKTMRAPTGRVWRWRNPESGNGGSMAASSPPQQAAGQTCRSFTETITLRDGRTNTFNGRACQRADGSWDIAA